MFFAQGIQRVCWFDTKGIRLISRVVLSGWGSWKTFIYQSKTRHKISFRECCPSGSFFVNEKCKYDKQKNKLVPVPLKSYVIASFPNWQLTENKKYPHRICGHIYIITSHHTKFNMPCFINFYKNQKANLFHGVTIFLSYTNSLSRSCIFFKKFQDPQLL